MIIDLVTVEQVRAGVKLQEMGFGTVNAVEDYDDVARWTDYTLECDELLESNSQDGALVISVSALSVDTPLTGYDVIFIVGDDVSGDMVRGMRLMGASVEVIKYCDLICEVPTGIDYALDVKEFADEDALPELAEWLEG